MSASCPYLLCTACLALCDWAEDPVVRSKGRHNRERAEQSHPMTHRCVTVNCETVINPLMKLCQACAGRVGLCQRCQKYLSAEEELANAPNPEREAMIDFFTVVVKTYGYAKAHWLFTELHAEELGEHANAAAAMRLDQLDQRLRRPIWTKVLGTNAYALRFCATCSGVPRAAPAILKASGCGHFTTGRSPAFCPVCAAERNLCEGCGSPVG